MKRREFIVLLGGAAAGLGAAVVARPLGAGAQQRRVWRVGFLAIPARPNPFDSSRQAAFVRGMRELGYIEGQNLVLEWRFADSNAERLPSLAEELVQLKPDVLVAAGTPAVAAAQRATTVIPIVMATVSDPVGTGFVASLGQPGGNITGLSNLSTDLSPKLLEMLVSIAPKLSRAAVLVNPTNRSHPPIAESLRAAAQKASLETLTVEAAAPQQLEGSFVKMRAENAGAVIVPADSFFIQQGRQIAELALRHRLPSVFPFREQVEAGGLLSYGQHLSDSFRRAANYVDKILKGSKPSDLPVEQATTLELVINHTTARALGLAIPPDLLILATEVIE